MESDENDETLINSDWPNKLSFPLFVQNTLTWLGGASKFGSSNGTSPGELISFRTTLPSKSATVRAPNNNRTELKPRSDNTFIYASANETGIYEVTDNATDTVDQLLPVNLLSPRESNLAVRDELNIGYEEIKSTRQAVPARKEYWPWVIGTALIVLLLEWYIYNRRVLI